MNIHRTGNDITVRAEISLRRSEPLAGTICIVEADVTGRDDNPDPGILRIQRLVLDENPLLIAEDSDIEYDAEEMARELGAAIFKKRILEAMKQCRK